MIAKREQAIGAVVFILLIVAGWAPYYLTSAMSSIYEPTGVLLGGLFALMAAGFCFDAAEKMFGTGKGIYATAILASFPASGIVLSEPPLLAESSLMFVSAATLWIAARAEKKNERESLALIAILCGIVLAVFGFWPPAFLPCLSFLVLYAKAGTNLRHLAIAFFVALLGLMAKFSLGLALPDIVSQQPDISISFAESIVLLAPWVFFGILTLIRGTTWTKLMLAGIVLLSILHSQFGGSWISSAGASAPLFAFAVTAFILRWFEADAEGNMRRVRWTAFPLALVLALLAVVRITRFEQILITHNHAVLGLLIAALLLAAMVRDARRSIFALHVLAGIAAGALWWQYSQYENYSELPPMLFDVAPWLVAAMFLLQAGTRFLYGRRMPRGLRVAGPRHKFDGAVFRIFSNIRRKNWEGDAVELTVTDSARVQFAIFGDIAGAESPLASRNPGYFAFKEIVRAIQSRKPDFAISTGDLAIRATHFAYRRLRMMLRRVTFPLLVTPGNHDIVEQGAIRPQFFHGLFGADHGDLTVGPVRLILIDNAWGSITDEQWQWIESTFSKSSTANHTIVFCHKPVFDPREDTFYGMEWRPHAERLHALFAKHKVSAVFSGHIHSLLNTEKDGVNYIISGGGGSKLKAEDDAHHYLWCAATPAEIRVTAYSVKASDPLIDLRLSARQ